MLLHDSRSDARTSETGDLILLEEQDRRLWRTEQIAAGLELVERALRIGRPGPYQIQAAIAALHARADEPKATDWQQISALYRELLAYIPSAPIQVNYAVAVAMATGPAAGLELLDRLADNAELDSYLYYHAARADLFRRSGDRKMAKAAYERALELAENEPTRNYFERRLREEESS